MADKPPSSWKATVARWFGLQVASKAVAVALGTPAVIGAMMAGLAYAQGLPLAWGFFTVIGVVAFTSTLLNQARSFLVGYSAANKMTIGPGEVIWALSKGGVDGYGLAISITNHADIPLEYRARRLTAHIKGIMVVAETPHASDGGIIEPGGTRLHALGVAPMERQCSAQLIGEVDVQAVYGRPGKLNHTIDQKMTVVINTNEVGATSFVRFVLQRDPGQ